MLDLAADAESVLIEIDSAFIDEASLRLLQADFLSFYNGLAFEPHRSFEEYVDYVSEKDHGEAERFWEGNLSGLVINPIYTFPVLGKFFG